MIGEARERVCEDMAFRLAFPGSKGDSETESACASSIEVGESSWSQFVGSRVKETSSASSSVADQKTSTGSFDSGPVETSSAQTSGSPGPALSSYVPPEATSTTAKPKCAGRRFMVRCRNRWRIRSGPSLHSTHVGSIPNGTVVVAALSEANGVVDDTARLWVNIADFEFPEQDSAALKILHGKRGTLWCLRRNKQGQGLYEIGVEPLDGELQSLPLELWAELKASKLNGQEQPTEEPTITHQVLNTVDSIVQFFSQLAPNRASVGPKAERIDHQPQLPKRMPNQLFEERQRKQVREATETLQRAVKYLISAAGTADARLATATLSADISSRFRRLRRNVLSACKASNDAGDQAGPARPIRRQRSSDSAGVFGVLVEGGLASDLEDDMELFVENCQQVETAGTQVSWDLRQELINFSQRHALDLERHGRFLMRSPDNRAAIKPKPVVRLVKPHFQQERARSPIEPTSLSSSQSETTVNRLPTLLPPPKPVSSMIAHA